MAVLIGGSGESNVVSGAEKHCTCIMGELEKLESNTAYLHEEIGRLEQRFAPVVEAAPDDKNVKTVPVGRTDVEAALRRANEAIDGAISRLAYLMERCGL